MCGRCRDVFNAFQSLTRVEDQTIQEKTSNTPAAEANDEHHNESNVTDPLFLRNEPAAPPAEFREIEAIIDQQISFPDEIAAPDSPEPFLAAIDPDTTDTYFSEAPGVASQDPVAKHDPSAVANPLLNEAKEGATIRPTERTWAWVAMSLLLGVALLAEGAFVYKSSLVQVMPETRSYYLKVCGLIGCNLSWGTDESAIKIESSDLVEAPAKAGRILFTATMANRSKTLQDLPFIELKLTDNSNQVIASRALSPKEYLGREPLPGEALPPNSEIFVNLNFEVGNKTSASGYAVRAFYP
jgi:hypothetical protein